MQSSVDQFNVVIAKIFGAADHGKGLIGAMSSFGFKSTLRHDIVTFNKWFSDRKEICEYLTFRGDHRMSYATSSLMLTIYQNLSKIRTMTLMILKIACWLKKMVSL